MKKILYTLAFTALMQYGYGQNKLRGAEGYTISLPSNYQRTVGLNSFANLQYELNSTDKLAFGFVITEHKDELMIAEVDRDIISYTLNSLSPYETDETFKIIQKPTITQAKDYSYSTSEFSVANEDGSQLYGFLTIIESKNFFYQIFHFGELDNKKALKPEFIKISESFRLE